MANLTKIVRGNLANVSQQTITNDTFYEVQDMPIGGITNAQMVDALTIPKKGFYQVGSVYLCTDTVANQYTANTFYKFTGSAWEELQVGSVTKEDIIRNLPPFKSTIQLSISDTTTAYTFPIVSSTNFAVDWGDGTFEFFDTATTSLTHTFSTTGTIYVQFYGDWNGFDSLVNNTFRLRIVNVWYDKNIISIPSYAFYGSSNLRSFNYNSAYLSVGSYAFGNNSGDYLKIDMSRLFNVGRNAFEGYRGEQILNIQKNAGPVGIIMGIQAFANLQVTEIYISTYNTLSTFIGTQAFINSTVRKLVLQCIYETGSNICYNCSNLKTIKIAQSPRYNNALRVTRLSDSLGSNLPSDLVILVPYSQLQAYKTATNWTTYANQIYPIGGQYSETVTIASTDWTLNSTTNLYEATATVVGATNESRNILDWSLVDSNGNQIEDTYGLGASAQGSMSITFTAQTAPVDAINIFVHSTLTNYQE